MGYTIGQTADKVGLSSYTLRYYEKEGLIPLINRNDSGIRSYSDEDIFWIDFVQCLKGTGMSLADIRQIISLSMEGQKTANIKEKKKILIAHREKVLHDIEALHKSLEKIEWKMSLMDQEMADLNNKEKDVID